MKPASYITVLLLSVVSVALCAALILLTQSNLRLQQQLQTRQEALRSGILGPQGQQISGSVLQEMAASAATNERMREVLGQHGYRLQPVAPAANAVIATNAAAPAQPAGASEEPKP